MNIFSRILLAINQSACLIFTGRNDMTLSGRSYIKHKEQGKSNWYNFVNFLFFWQEDHCRDAMIWEYRAARTMTERYADLYKEAHDDKFGE
ncbi:hypothetical protein NVP1081O_260 [Vibrio phage 1.081.O._10N.286.52.C2]|nr:hypothetical protein NVP1081O_260 [Vibrio phage 1.081.O._10N.286.52.C2]